jgi:hypothetical protein
MGGYSYLHNMNNYASSMHERTFQALFNYRNTGPHRIAEHLWNHGYDTEVVDYSTFFPVDDLRTLLAHRIKNGVQYIGVSYTFLAEWSGSISSLYEYLKQKYPNVLLMVGGQNFGMQVNLNADVYIEGFAENNFVSVLDAQFKGKEWPRHQWYFNDTARYIDSIHTNPSWPLPSYSLRLTDEDFLTSRDVLSLELERGCRFKCKFCEFPILGVKEDYSIDEDIIYDELLSNYERFGIKHYFISDETINARDTKLKSLANAVQRLPFEPMLNGFVRLDLFHKNTDSIQMLIDGNVIGHHYGIETFHEQAGKIVGKGYDPEKNKDMLLQVRDMFKEQGRPFHGTISMIAGLPTQTVESIYSDMQWYRDHYRDNHMHWYALNISNEDQSSGSNISAFGTDFSKYGFEVMSENEFMSKIDGKMEMHLGNDITYEELSKRTKLWKNPIMDTVDAWDLVHEFNVNQGLGMSSWTAVAAMAAGFDGIDQFDHNSYTPLWDDIIETSHTHIQNYIDNKMLTCYM